MAEIGDGDCARPVSSASSGCFWTGLKKEKRGPFVIGVAGGTASGKVIRC